jgi:hypothetical protein
MQLFYESDALSLSQGERLRIDGSEFAEFDPAVPERFAAHARSITESAGAWIDAIRRSHGDGPAGLRFVARLKSKDAYVQYDAGVASGLLGNTRRARRRFDQVCAGSDDRDWVQVLENRSRRLKELLNDPAEFRAEIVRAIEVTRSMLKLAKAEITF